jgi:predicted Zn-dependent protease with MMP-like domain
MDMPPAAFNRLVADALDGLPDEVAGWLDNVEVLVDDWPSPAQTRDVGVRRRDQLLGLYEGVPRTERTSDYGMVLPDRITLFRRPILAVCATPEEAAREVRRTVLHELAHHFGIDDDRLEELGAY